jgi:hypothetical protein
MASGAGLVLILAGSSLPGFAQIVVGGTALAGAAIGGGATYLATDIFDSPLEDLAKRNAIGKRVLFGKGADALIVDDMETYIELLKRVLNEIRDAR